MSTSRQDWHGRYALGLPAGSVRALLAILVFGGLWAWLLLRSEVEVPDYLQILLFIIIGHYFAVRHESQREEDAGPPPLFLPTGSVRLILIGGFIAVGVALYQQDRLWLADADGTQIHHGVLTLILVGGFLFGVAIARLWALFTKSASLPRWLEDTRAILSLAAAVLLLLLLFGLIEVPAWGPLEHLRRLGGGNGINSVLAAIVGFYFGSRS